MGEMLMSTKQVRWNTRCANRPERNAGKGRKPIVKLSWELLTPFSDFLRGLPTQQNRAEEEEEEDEDEMQAHQDSMQRLRVRRCGFPDHHADKTGSG